MIIPPEYKLYRCEQIRACEQLAKTLLNTSEHELMARAGAQAFSQIIKLYPQARNWAVFCGAGNNAGDGYVVARLAHEHGINCIIYSLKNAEELPGAAADAALQAISQDLVCVGIDEPIDTETDLIIDALLGIGLQGELRGEMAAVINQINESNLPVVALDLPSGLNADTGEVVNCCVRADHTITFIAAKAGMLTLDGPDYCGKIHCADLQLKPIVERIQAFAAKLNRELLPLPLPCRVKNSHKGDYGQVLVIGGNQGMPGAVWLAAKAALLSGAGSAVIATWPKHIPGALSFCPEAMIYGVACAKELESLLSKATVCILGPGLGEDEWAQEMFHTAMISQLPMVIDASALHLLASSSQCDDNWVLTPHPGEAAALLSCKTEEIQANRFSAADEIQKRYGGVVVLKGAGTIVKTSDGQNFIGPTANPLLATAGTGDILSGIIAGLIAQKLSLSEAAKTAVWLHGYAADHLTPAFGQQGLLASDLLPFIPKILKS